MEKIVTEDFIDKVRMLSQATGKIYDFQLLNLKSIPLVMFGENLKNEVSVDCDNMVVKFNLTGKCQHKPAEIKVRVAHLVQYVRRLLGSQYKVALVLNKKVIYGNRDKPSEKTGRNVKPSRKKSVPGVRKQKQAKPKPENGR